MSPVAQCLLRCLAVGALALGLAACGSDPVDGLRADAVSLLACTSKTGSQSYAGPALYAAMELAVEDVNGAGGVLGQPLQLVPVDDHSDEVPGLAEARFYYERYRDSIVGIAGTILDRVTEKLLSDIAADDLRYGQQIPIVSPASASPEFSEALDRSGLFFRTVLSAENEGIVLARKAQRLGYKRGAIIAFRDPMGSRILESFRVTFGSFGAEYQTTGLYYATTDRRGIVAAFDRLGTLSPEFVLLVGYGDDGKVALSEWSARFPSLPLMLTSTLASDAFLASLDQRTLTALAEVAVNGTRPSSDPSSPSLAAFRTRFCTRFPSECACPLGRPGCDPATEGEVASYVPNAYDAVFLQAVALEVTGRAAPQAVQRGSSWDVKRLTGQLVEVTQGEAKTRILPGQWAELQEALSAGQEVRYQGASADDFEFDALGDMRTGFYVFWSVQAGKVRDANSNGVWEGVTVRY